MRSHLSLKSLAYYAIVPLVLLPTLSAHAGNIDTISSWDGITGIGPFGASSTVAGISATQETYGQVITPDANQTLLTNFEFRLKPDFGVTWSFRPYVYKWDGVRATGSALFTGSTQTLVGDNSYHAITASTGNVPLTAGQSYVLFLSMANPTNYNASTFNGGGVWGELTNNPYSGGQFVFQNSDNDPTKFTGADWSTDFSTSDLAFKATLSQAVTAPEPSTLLLLLLPGAFLLYRRKRSSDTEA